MDDGRPSTLSVPLTTIAHLLPQARVDMLRRMFQQLRQQGITVAVVTRNSRHVILKCLGSTAPGVGLLSGGACAVLVPDN